MSTRALRLLALCLLALCLAVGAAAPVRAQQRDITALLDDAGPALEADAGVEAAADAGAAEAPDAGAEASGADAAVTGASADPGEPAVPDDEEPALPEGHVPTISVRLSPDSGLMTGDVVHYELTVEVPEGDDVNLPRQSYAPLELVGQDHQESVANGRRRFVYTLDLLALAPGEITIPALTVRVITADGVVGTVRTEEQHVTVGSLVANEPDAQPRPPTEPVVVMQDDYTLAYIAGALGLMAVTALFTWLFLRWWRARPKELPPPPPPRPAHEVAMEKLRALRRELTAAIADGSQARVVDGASDALREYLGHRFGFNGLESTTDEVITSMRQQRLAGVTLAEITTLLGECDLVKFAKAVPDQNDCEKVIGEAERIVQRTMHLNVVAITPPAAPSAPTLKEPKLPEASEAPKPEPLSVPARSQGGQPSATSALPPAREPNAPTEPAPNEPAPNEPAPTESSEAAARTLPSGSADPTPASSAPTPLAFTPIAPTPIAATPVPPGLTPVGPGAPAAQRTPAPISESSISESTLSAGSNAIPLTNPPPPPDARTIEEPTPSFAIPATPVPPPAPRDSEPELPRATAEEILAKAAEALAKASQALAKPSDLSNEASEPSNKASELSNKPSATSGLSQPSTAVTAILGGLAQSGEDEVWDALDAAVADDRLITGEVLARREEGFLVALGGGVHGVLPEAQLGDLSADELVGQTRAFRVVSLNAGRKRVVLSHRDVDAAAERDLTGRATPIGFHDPSDRGGSR